MPQSGLSRREREILALIALGYSDREIAAILYIAYETVKTHVAHVLRKLDARSRAEAVYRGIQDGWLTTSSREPMRFPSGRSARPYVGEWNGEPEELLRLLIEASPS